MKTIKLILATLLMMVAFTVQAQERVVQVYKDGKVVKEYPANEVKSVEYVPVIDYGYYSFNATSLDFSGLTASDFTKLTNATSEVTCGKKCYPVVLTKGTTPPISTWWSNGGNGYGKPSTMDSETDYSGLTITINGTKYNVWCEVNPTSATDTAKIKIEIK